jgi:hypothetical protein
VGLRYYDGLWAGIWRSGTDGYYLWANANESAFLAKWGGLATQNLRLIDVIATPFGGATGSDTAVVDGRPAGVLFGTSELTFGRSGSAPPSMGASGGAGEGGGTALSGGDLPAAIGPGRDLGATRTGEGGGTALGGGDLPPATGPDRDPDATRTGEGGGSVELVDEFQTQPSGAGAGGGSAVPGGLLEWDRQALERAAAAFRSPKPWSQWPAP